VESSKDLALDIPRWQPRLVDDRGHQTVYNFMHVDDQARHGRTRQIRRLLAHERSDGNCHVDWRGARVLFAV